MPNPDAKGQPAQKEVQKNIPEDFDDFRGKYATGGEKDMIDQAFAGIGVAALNSTGLYTTADIMGCAIQDVVKDGWPFFPAVIMVAVVMRSSRMPGFSCRTSCKV